METVNSVVDQYRYILRVRYKSVFSIHLLYIHVHVHVHVRYFPHFLPPSLPPTSSLIPSLSPCFSPSLSPLSPPPPSPLTPSLFPSYMTLSSFQSSFRLFRFHQNPSWESIQLASPRLGHSATIPSIHSHTYILYTCTHTTLCDSVGSEPHSFIH